MTLSDALPIQFWDIDDDTYNESPFSGMTDACFCQEWEIDDNILIQFYDTSGYTFYITPAFTDGTYGTPDAFTESSDWYSLTNTAASLGVSEQQRFTLLISRGSPVSLTTYPILAPSAWTDVAAFDSKTATTFVENGLNATKIAEQACVVPAGLRITITATITITGTVTGSVGLDFYLASSAGGSSISEYVNDPQVDFTAAGVYQVIYIIEASSDATLLEINLSPPTAGAPNVTIEIGNIGGTLIVGGIEKKSDCQIFYTDDDEPSYFNCNTLITYSNDTNVFDLNYESGSPSAQFNVRVPSRFFHESYPQQEEVHELSTDEFVSLWSKLDRKKLLEIGFVPYFMHKKLQLILMHDNITIDGEYWVRRDPYQITEGSNKYPLKKASVLLTDKDTIERNLI